MKDFMEFKYSESFDKDKEKWLEFDKFLTGLSEMHSEEFSKEMYKNQRFMAIGYRANPSDITYAFNEKVPQDIQFQILQKLKQLFP